MATAPAAATPAVPATPKAPARPTLGTLDERVKSVEKALEGAAKTSWTKEMVVYGLIAFAAALAIYGIITAPSKKGILDEASTTMKSFFAQAIDDNNKWVKDAIGKQHAETIKEVRGEIVPGAISGTMDALKAGLILGNGKCNTCTEPAPVKAATLRPAPVSTGCGSTCLAAAQPQQKQPPSGAGFVHYINPITGKNSTGAVNSPAEATAWTIKQEMACTAELQKDPAKKGQNCFDLRPAS